MSSGIITVERKDGFNVKLSRVLREATSHKLDLYLFVPGELGLTTHVIAENEFYHNAIHTKRTYYSDKHHLPLIHSRLASRGRLSSEQYRLSLSLYAYQYVVGLETSTRELLEADEQTMLAQSGELIELSLNILKRLRRSTPSDEGMLQYYINIDNYLSWFTEQRLLLLVACLSGSDETRPIREQLLALCEAENAYRLEQNYNSSHVLQDPERISNKMRLLRRLIEHPVTLNEKTQALGNGEERLVKGTATAVVMIFVTLMVLQANHVLSHLTTLFVFVLAIIYALREVFKDDLRNTLWRWLRKGRPKWRRLYFDAYSGKQVGRQFEWFDYKRSHKLGEEIRAARKANVTQREEVVLHYGSSSRMLPTRFLSGYEEIRETLQLDLNVLSKLMDKGAHEVYQLSDGEVFRATTSYAIDLEVTRQVPVE